VELYQFLKDQKTQIEKEFGCNLVWDEQEHLVSRRIMSKRVKQIDITSPEEVEELLEWFLAEHKKFKKFIFPRVYDFVDSLE
jgi:hypothetical protein